MKTQEVIELLQKADKAIHEQYQPHDSQQSIAALAIERIQELEQELGLMKISLEHKTTLLNSCEIALEREQFPPK